MKKELKKKSFMSEDKLQQWVNTAEIELVSVTNNTSGVTAWYYDDPRIVTVRGSDIGVKVTKIFGRK